MTNPATDLERSVIGSVLLRADNLALLPTLEIADFVSPLARYTWEAIRNLEHAGRPIDVVTIADEITRRRAGERDNTHDREQKRIEADAYLGGCALATPTADNAIEYARRLKDHRLRRRLIETLVEVVDHARKGDATGAELLTMALAGLSVLDAEQPEKALAIGDVIRRRMAQLDEIAKERALGLSALSGFATGVSVLDDKLGGWQPGIVSLIAARPGMGKSSLGLATADACSVKGVGCHVFSLEDTESAYADRAMARTCGVSAESIRNCDLNAGDVANMKARMPSIAKRKHWLLDDRSGVSAAEIVRSVRRHKKPNGTRVAIVDYVQLVAKPDRRMNAHEAISENVSTFADAAKQDGIAYVVMSQLNREIEKREDKRPQLSDLRESGSLEERAKCVVGVYRGAVYGHSPKKGIDFQVAPPSSDDFERQVQLLVLKNSNGRTGRVFATWHGATMRIE